MKYLMDKDGNVFKAHVVSSIPEGFKDVSGVVDVDAVDLGSEHIEAVEVAEVVEIKEVIAVEAVIAVEEVIEHWTDGTDTVYDANDIPTLLDENGDAYLDPNYSHVEAVAGVEGVTEVKGVTGVKGVPAHYRIKKHSKADQALRQAKIDELSILRQSLLVEADIEINKLVDNGQDASAFRTYRQALRDITESYKKVNGDWKVAVDSLVIEEFVFPSKPQ